VAEQDEGRGERMRKRRTLFSQLRKEAILARAAEARKELESTSRPGMANWCSDWQTDTMMIRTEEEFGGVFTLPCGMHAVPC
jgi:hypothetical protein